MKPTFLTAMTFVMIGLFVVACQGQVEHYRQTPEMDKAVIAVADVAIEAKSKEEKLAPAKILKAEVQVVTGTIDRISFDVRAHGDILNAQAATWAKQNGDFTPFPGKITKWNGFAQHDFQVDGASVIVVEPAKPLPGRPWAWRGEFFGAFPNADIELVKNGWHLAYINVPNLFGSPKAVARWEKFHDKLVKQHGLHPKPGLIGLSRGALYCMAWAAAHPDKTLAVYLDNGVCDFKSWPGGKVKELGIGQGSAGEWQNLLKAFDFKDDKEAIAYKGNPVDNLAPLAKAKLPMLLVYGDSDKVVPHKENSEIVFDRYKALGGSVERIVKAGGDHHPHGLPDPKPVVKFFEKAWSSRK